MATLSLPSWFDPSPFYPHQIKAASTIVKNFYTVNYALLWAQVQSGKSGTFHCVASIMLSLGLIERVYILCGSSELTLREQAISDTKKYQKELSNLFQVLFRQDFRSHYASAETPLQLNNTLIIIDESHLDQSKGQELHKLLNDYDLDLSGSKPHMKENNTFILSVDATPYAEYSSYIRGESPLPKYIHIMKAGDGYVGPLDFMDGHLHNSTPMKKEYSKEIAKYIKKYSTNKYAVFRTRGNQTKLLYKIARNFGFDICEYTSNRTDIVMTSSEKPYPEFRSLEDFPKRTTIVIISGRLRAGKVLPKQHIGMVWESSRKPNTDVIVQGLWGRVCGYYPEGLERPHVFMSLDYFVSSGELDRYWNCHYSTHSLPFFCPMKATNVKSSKKDIEVGFGRVQSVFISSPDQPSARSGWRRGTEGSEDKGENANQQKTESLTAND
jgi:hypothetical protein